MQVKCECCDGAGEYAEDQDNGQFVASVTVTCMYCNGKGYFEVAE
jgi:DnaJ-class molecular chaperone